MTRLASTLGVSIVLLVAGCTGARRQAAEPPAVSEQPAAAHGSADEPEASARFERESLDHRSSTEEPSVQPSEPPKASTSEAAGEAVAGSAPAARGEAKPVENCRESSSPLSLTVDRKTVSLEEGRLQAKMDGPICSLHLRIIGNDGQQMLDKAFDYTGPEPQLRWEPVPRSQIEKVEIRVSSKDGGYQSVFLIPWSVAIEHKEVEFDTNKAVIRGSELGSLEDSLTKINDVLAKVEGKELGTITLFIAGHTDTQGSNEHNMTLSRNRAQAIAAWFIGRGLCIPVAYEGFGESALKKVTADGVDEQANRRADYILSVEPPMISKSIAPVWKWSSKGC